MFSPFDTNLAKFVWSTSHLIDFICGKAGEIMKQ